MSVSFFPYETQYEPEITVVVVAIRYQEHWLYFPAGAQDGWQIPTQICCPECTIDDTAGNCLNRIFDRLPDKVTVVSLFRHEQSIGLLLLAEIPSGKDAPRLIHNQILLSETLPKDLAQPELYGRLYDRIQGWRNVQTSADDLWDVYDHSRNLTGRLHRRGDPLAKGEYHLTVHVWIQNSDGRLLITKRAPNKGYAGLWECTGGSALAGDDSLTAAIREAKEETGLALKSENGTCILQRQGWDWFNDVWLFHQEIDPTSVLLQPGETCDYRWASPEEVLAMNQAGMMVPFAYLNEFLTGGILDGKRDR